MKKNELLAFLNDNYSAFINYVDSLSNQAYHYSEGGKWSAGLHLSHLVLSVKPLARVFELDKVIIAQKFGSSTELRRSYAEIKSIYFEKLKDGGKAPDRFVPETESAIHKFALSKTLETLINQLGTAIERFSEEELDTLLVPHPLIGNLSLREMLYNAIYHAEHHQNLIVTMLNGDFSKLTPGKPARH